MYNFTRANERISSEQFISLIGISNSLTFKDKLDPRVKSSLSEEELVFNPYTIEQLKQILLDRCKLAFYDDVVPSGVINLCAAIAGRETGDARKAIDLLRVAAEIAERSMTMKISEEHIRHAQKKIDSDTNFEILSNSTLHTKLVILSTIRSKNASTGKFIQFIKIFVQDFNRTPNPKKNDPNCRRVRSTRIDNNKYCKPGPIWKDSKNKTAYPHFICKGSN